MSVPEVTWADARSPAVTRGHLICRSFLAVFLLAPCALAQAPPKATPGAGPSDLIVEVRSASGSNTFRAGDSVNLELAFSSAAPHRYYEPCGRIAAGDDSQTQDCKFFNSLELSIAPVGNGGGPPARLYRPSASRRARPLPVVQTRFVPLFAHADIPLPASRRVPRPSQGHYRPRPRQRQKIHSPEPRRPAQRDCNPRTHRPDCRPGRTPLPPRLLKSPPNPVSVQDVSRNGNARQRLLASGRASKPPSSRKSNFRSEPLANLLA